MTAPFQRREINETFENCMGSLLVDSSCAIEERRVSCAGDTLQTPRDTRKRPGDAERPYESGKCVHCPNAPVRHEQAVPTAHFCFWKPPRFVYI